MGIFWFYRFHDTRDFIKGTILLIILNVIMIPFDILSVQFVILGNSYYYLVIVLSILAINLGYYIKAVICWIIDTRKQKKLAKMGQALDPNVDIIWQIDRR